jgi:hypothetical protein
MLDAIFNKLLGSFVDPVNLSLLLAIGIMIWVRLGDKVVMDKLVDTSNEQNRLLQKAVSSIDLIAYSIMGGGGR